MLVTEEEAGKKWCPQVRIIDSTHYARSINNRGRDGGDNDVNCLGSRCMAWRVLDTRGERGYCGYAGVPHSHGLD
jgi:hypothetical protein